VRGRFFDDRDGRSGPAVIVVDERFAQTYFAGLDPLRQSVRLVRSGRELPIVGVAGHIVTRSLESPDRPQVYLPLFGISLHFTSVIVRTATGDPLARMADVRAVAKSLDPNLPLFNAASMATLVADTLRPERLAAYATTTFALSALALASIGLVGILTFSIALRTRELGIRLALGAAPGRLVARLVAYGTSLTLVGVVAGLAAGMAAARTMAARFAAAAPASTWAIAVSAVVLLVTGAGASYLPARRVASIDPAEVLKGD
jgi:putative ABC transport system permease protein